VNSSSEGTRVDDLYASLPQLGTATGAGTVSPQGALNFQVVARINANSSALSGLTSVAGGALGQVAANGIPVHITGTTSSPVIQADLSRLLEKNAGNILKQQILGNGNKQPNASDVMKLFHH